MTRMNTVQLIYQAVTTATEKLPPKLGMGQKQMQNKQSKYFKRPGKQSAAGSQWMEQSVWLSSGNIWSFLLNKQRYLLSFSSQGTPGISVAPQGDGEPRNNSAEAEQPYRGLGTNAENHLAQRAADLERRYTRGSQRSPCPQPSQAKRVIKLFPN